MYPVEKPCDPVVRLAFCSAGELFGGVERQLLGLCDYLLRRGRTPCLILFHDRELAAQARQRGLEPQILPARHRYDFRGAHQLAYWLAERQINVVHAHGYRAVVNCALAQRRHRFVLVKTEHGLPESAQGNPADWVKSRLYCGLETWATRASRAVVCYVTEDIRRKWQRSHRHLRRETIYNGIDPLDGSSLHRPADLQPGLCHLAIVGRVTDIKGISFALQAVASDVPDQVRLNIIGTGPSRQRLERQALRLGLGDRVRFLGFRRNVFDYLAHCSALLMPSLHEGLPYTLLEAMSLGKVILASRVGGLAEVLRDGHSAWLFAPREVAGIRRTIWRLVDRPELARKLAEAARRDQLARFTLEAMGDRYWDTYAACLTAEAGYDG
jgi:glycosyltransferase involved in cell wall biosynthesis